MRRHFKKHISDAYSYHSEKYVSVLEPVLAPMAKEITQIVGLSSWELTLDLATGTGLIARELARLDRSVIGVDLSPGILRIADAQSRREIQFVSGDAHELPFKDRCFDLVTCVGSASHTFLNVMTALGEIHKLNFSYTSSAIIPQVHGFSTWLAAIEVFSRNERLLRNRVLWGH
jgi:SAM-dependent methyltransferase